MVLNCIFTVLVKEDMQKQNILIFRISTIEVAVDTFIHYEGTSNLT